ncbi:MAG TPA: enolase C-terminal domain-like protein, partial [Longimicrobium sp.]|nr:enolase C-terminal domain-like protein [Longimicrobium sp.]
MCDDLLRGVVAGRDVMDVPGTWEAMRHAIRNRGRPGVVSMAMSAQADGTRCGGITEFLRVAALCAARSLPLSAHTAPTLHVHPCCAVAPACHVEYFHDHARIEQHFFDGA